MEINNVTVKTNTQYISKYKSLMEDNSDRQSYSLILEFQVPGGKAIYEIPIEKATLDNLEIVTKLAQKP